MRSKTVRFTIPAGSPDTSASQVTRRAASRWYQPRKRASNPSSPAPPSPGYHSAVHARRSAARAGASAAAAILTTGALIREERTGAGAARRAGGKAEAGGGSPVSGRMIAVSRLGHCNLMTYIRRSLAMMPDCPA